MRVLSGRKAKLLELVVQEEIELLQQYRKDKSKKTLAKINAVRLKQIEIIENRYKWL